MKPIRSIALGAAGLIVLACLFVVMPSPVSAANATRIFSHLAPRLKPASAFPVLLPKYLPDYVMQSRRPRAYARIEESTSKQYDVVIGWVPDCNGGASCLLGDIIGSTKPLPLTGKPVKLSNGATAYYTPASCGAYCGEATLAWRYRNAYYQVGIRVAKESTLVAVANNMTAY